MAWDRGLVVCLGVSTLLHLSAVTLFSIVVLLPRQPIHYYRLEVVSPENEATEQPAASGPPEVPSLRDPLDVVGGNELPTSLAQTLEVAAASAPYPALPPVELPGLDPPELSRLRLRAETPRLRVRPEGLEDRPRRDSWARFGEGVGHFRDALARLGQFGRAGRGDETVLRPLTTDDGFDITVEWMSGGSGRRLLYGPPVEDLWRVDPSQLPEPVVLVFEVNPRGEVVALQSPLEDEAGVVAAAARALARYRFEPLEGADQGNQHGTLRITPRQAPS